MSYQCTPDEITVLSAIGSSEPSTFNEFCRAYPDTPTKGNKDGWRELFGRLEWLEHQELLTIERIMGKIESLQLTDAGADQVRGSLDRERGLFAELDK